MTGSEKCVWEHRKCEYRAESSCNAEESYFNLCGTIKIEFEELHAELQDIYKPRARALSSLSTELNRQQELMEDFLKENNIELLDLSELGKER